MLTIVTAFTVLEDDGFVTAGVIQIVEAAEVAEVAEVAEAVGQVMVGNPLEFFKFVKR